MGKIGKIKIVIWIIIIVGVAVYLYQSYIAAKSL